MAETELQLMISGDQIADYIPSVTSEKISIKEVVTLPNRNYLLIYLDLTGAVPETFDLVFTRGSKKITVPYELKERNPERMAIESFGPSDVLYLIMPDRFANGDPSNDQIPMRTSYKVDRNNPNARHGGDLERYLRQTGLSFRPGSDRHLAEPGTGERHGRRLLPWLCYHQLLQG